MKTTILAAILFLSPFLGSICHAQPSPDCDTCIGLNAWYFLDTNWLTYVESYPPAAFTNIVNLDGTYGNELLLDTTNTTPAFLLYHLIDTNTDTTTLTNLTLSQGTISLWFSPDWSTTNHGGNGPGDWANLISLGQTGTNGTPWWAWYLSPDGATIYFASQTNGHTSTTWLTAPVTLLTTNWYNLVLTYNSSNTAIYTNGVFLTNGPPITNWPGPGTTTFAIGSDTNGLFQARGAFGDLETFNYALNSNTVSAYFVMTSIFFGAAGQDPSGTVIMPAPSTNSITPVFDAVTGPGFLQGTVSTNTYPTSSNIWLTNYGAAIVATNVINLKFAVAGGSNNVAYDVFATAAIQSPITNALWYWMGQAYRGTNYTLPITNSPLGSVFLILGTPQDTDQDGLTDAYELLVSHTNPHAADTSGDGMLDGWKIVWGLNPLTNNPAQSAQRLDYGYDPAGRLKQVTGIFGETIGIDGEENVLSAY